MNKPRRTLEQALELTKRWLASAQPAGAVISHFGGGTDSIVDDREVYIQAAPRGETGAWLCVNLQNTWVETKPSKTCGSCNHTSPSEGNFVHYTKKQKSMVLRTVRKVFGRRAIHTHWGGGEFISMDVSTECNASLCETIQRYMDGCPECQGSVFCGTHNHKWKKGFRKAKDIDDVSR